MRSLRFAEWVSLAGSALVSLSALAAPALVQVTQDQLGGAGVSGKTTLSFAAPAAAGDLVAVALEEDQLPLPVVTDNHGDPYQLAIGPVAGKGALAGCCASSIFFAGGIDGGADPLTLTFTYGSGTYHPEIVAAEYSGVRTLNALDGASSDAGLGSALLSSGTLVTHVDGELLFVTGATAGGVLDAGAGFTMISTNGGDLWADSVVGAAGPYTDFPLTDNGGGWMVAMASFVPSEQQTEADAGLVGDAGLSPDGGPASFTPTPGAGPFRADYDVGWGCAVVPVPTVFLCALLIGPLRRHRRRGDRP